MNLFNIVGAAALIAGAEAAWQTVEPGGATSCTKGDYAFFFRPGTENKLLVEFQGGGVCWDERSCTVTKPYTESVNIESQLRSLERGAGIQDHENGENPFAGWSHLFLPYCSADLFVGQNPWSKSRPTSSRQCCIGHI